MPDNNIVKQWLDEGLKISAGGDCCRPVTQAEEREIWAEETETAGEYV